MAICLPEMQKSTTSNSTDALYGTEDTNLIQLMKQMGMSSAKPDSRADATGGEEGAKATIATTRPRHIRQNAMTWEDLALVLHEMMEANIPAINQHKNVKTPRSIHNPHNDGQSTISSLSLDLPCKQKHKISSHSSGKKVPSEVYVYPAASSKSDRLTFESDGYKSVPSLPPFLLHNLDIEDGQSANTPPCLSDAQKHLRQEIAIYSARIIKQDKSR